ncbi:efflux RND transporter periplasmic adaptor subunit [Flavobacterium sp. P4023]|uniref:Efflux RND transporter periplasmic adaptor subunit n=1 Tax=Flavobacterium flabelliforme TaxID=2816119 RepID=A0ABS5CTI8_9FLAO|nr:biotin/lipoyl-binding protein [Flavobacterium flabelliforme]MBP4141939.1 efflux RND transporter periplasmic adaptor subunit [Flavobacterium flabelliforme]
MKNKITILFSMVLFSMLLYSCNKKEAAVTETETIIPVTVTTVDNKGIDDFEEVSGTVSYIVKTPIKAIITGYVTAVNATTNDKVAKGKRLFSIKTKESIALGNDVNKLDPNLHFGTAVSITSSSNGFITAVNVEKGNYVQEGDILAVINDSDNYGVVINVPFELKKYVSINQQLSVYLPDGTSISATVKQFIPSVDTMSQMQSIFLKMNSNQVLPENLIVSVRIPKSNKSDIITLPKSAILSNEIETEYWVMLLRNDSTAIKVPVQIGLKNQERTEIITPKFNVTDRIVTSGNYGVGDTIKVKIINGSK